MKSLSLIAVAGVLAFALSACGGSDNKQQPAGTTTPPAQSQPAGAPQNANP